MTAAEALDLLLSAIEKAGYRPAENIVLAMQARRGAARALSRSRQNTLADQYIEALKIKTPDRETPGKTGDR